MAPLPLRIDRKITVVGVRDQHLGPKCERARATVSIEPSDCFVLIDATGDEAALQHGYVDRFARAFLNWLALTYSIAESGIRVTIESIEHDFESSLMAFQRAGEDAGRKMVVEVEGRPTV